MSGLEKIYKAHTKFQFLELERSEFAEDNIHRMKGKNMELKFCARILQNENMDAAYVEVPYDIKDLF